jgi:hypothetical protein
VVGGLVRGQPEGHSHWAPAWTNKTNVNGHMTKLLPVLARQESSAYSAVSGDPIPVRGLNSKRESSPGKAEKLQLNKQDRRWSQTPFVWFSRANIDEHRASGKGFPDAVRDDSRKPVACGTAESASGHIRIVRLSAKPKAT